MPDAEALSQPSAVSGSRWQPRICEDCHRGQALKLLNLTTQQRPDSQSSCPVHLPPITVPAAAAPCPVCGKEGLKPVRTGKGAHDPESDPGKVSIS